MTLLCGTSHVLHLLVLSYTFHHISCTHSGQLVDLVPSLKLRIMAFIATVTAADMTGVLWDRDTEADRVKEEQSSSGQLDAVMECGEMYTVLTLDLTKCKKLEDLHLHSSFCISIYFLWF